MPRHVLITGASTGLGLATARELVRHGYHVFGSVRKEADGKRVREELGAAFTPLVFDVTDHGAISSAVELVRSQIGAEPLAAVVNNAGLNAIAPLAHQPLDEVRRLFDVNVLGVIAVTQAFLPLLKAGRDAGHAPGRVVNVSSVSGAVTMPFLGAYSATKHALESVTDALRRELAIYGIHVVAVEPGSIRTPIFDKVGEVDPRYASTDYAPALATMPQVLAREWKGAIPIEKVTRTIRTAIEVPRPKTRYPLTALWHARTWLSDRMLDRVTTRAMGLRRIPRRS